MPPESLLEDPLAPEAFLRSIHVGYDAEEPQRIGHFHPTSKAVRLLRALLGEDGDRAFLVEAPYGTGKSLTAAYLLHLVENRPDSGDMLASVEEKLRPVSPELADFSRDRRQSGDQGLVLALHGHAASLPEALKDAAVASMKRLKLGRQARAIESQEADTVEDAVGVLRQVQQKVARKGFDRITILWDEFGRHVENLIAEGRHADLAEVQTLAELASRSAEPPVTLGLLLHQGLLHYAGNAPQSVQAEWRKIEGRFKSIQYVEDSREIFRLIAEVASARRGSPAPTQQKIEAAAKRAHKLGLFGDFKADELAELLGRAYPLEPATLHLLPRISARVAQNERTLFTFLYHADFSDSIGPDALYDYFAEAMRADTAVGGTHKQWLETESAITKAGDDPDAIRALKIACLLGLGTSGERARASRELLIAALQGLTQSRKKAEATVDDLVERKLLLHRRHNDEVSVWHGTDADLRGKLEEEKRSQREHFDLVAFLEREAPPPVWRPVEYNDDYLIRRYLTGEYRDASGLEAYADYELRLNHLPQDCDGKIVYLVAESAADLERAERVARERLDEKRVVVALPREPVALFDAALEVHCLMRMQQDPDLIGADPLLGQEIEQMADDARAHLQRIVDRFVHPGPSGPRFVAGGETLDVASPRDLRKALSDLMREVFPQTPRINNEMINRKKVSAALINGRRKLMLGILERSGDPSLGLEGYTPDVSMFRTVLLQTGLYRDGEDGRGYYAAPSAVKDPGLRAVWQRLHEFLTTPDEKPKRPEHLFAELTAPPYGVRAGVLPILFAAALKAFPTAISLMRDGEYVTDILPSEIEQLCRNPDRYRVVVPDLDDEKLAYLRQVHALFANVESYEVAEGDLIRLCYDAVEAWKAQLPPAALTTRRVGDAAQRLQKVLQRPADPVRLLFEQVPDACGQGLHARSKLVETLEAAKAELESVANLYAEQAAGVLIRSLAFGHADASDARTVGRRWADCFPDRFVDALHNRVQKGLITRLRTDYDADDRLINALGVLLVGRPLSRWDDSSVTTFERELQANVREIEEIALAQGTSLAADGESPAGEGLAELVRGRFEELFERLEALVGPERARTMVEAVAEKGKERPHGDDR